MMLKAQMKHKNILKVVILLMKSDGQTFWNVQDMKIRGFRIMAKDKETPCLYYVCAGLCKKGRKAEQDHYL